MLTYGGKYSRSGKSHGGKSSESKPPSRAVLGIDFGSTAVRACFVPHDKSKVFQVIENPDSSISNIFNHGDFPTACCPFSDNPLESIGEQAVSNPYNVSAKYLMYLLADASDDVMERYPLSGELRNRRGDKAFLATCRKVLVCLMQQVKARVDEVAQSRRITYEEIVLTLPIQWEKVFQDQYVSIIKEAFEWQDMDRVHVITEAVALAHYMMEYEDHHLEDWDFVMFVDAGGHSMSYSIYKVDWFEHQISFIEVDSDGTAGGSEMWSHEISKVIAAKLEDREPDFSKELKKTIVGSLTKQFGSKKGTVMADTSHTNLYYTHELDFRRPEQQFTTIKLTPDEIVECFKEGLKLPMAMAKNQLNRIANLGDEIMVGVVVAGGSLRTKEAKEIFFADCPLPMDRIKFVEDMNVRYVSVTNCHGAAVAITKKRTVMEFLRSGAAIAIQKLTLKNNNKLWDDLARMVLNKDQPIDQVEEVHGENELRIIVDPFYEQRMAARAMADNEDSEDRKEAMDIDDDDDGEDGIPVLAADEPKPKPRQSKSNTPKQQPPPPQEVRPPTLHFEDCYDLFHLGRRKGGRLTYMVSLKELPAPQQGTSASGNNSTVVLDVTVLRRHQAMSRGRTEAEHWELPIYFDPGHNCVHVDIDAMPDSERVFAEQGELRGGLRA
ncbi:hypothetical protein B0T24DRAFT_695468 [Lasiosphaeria ovina]|uniref:Uncharacterized protein n=1 Tax=Lasiosphaeria ovina TaxID=92902 RepID=A0AAE0TSA5_9PEZI|nr:hypothetical protein B0T24DRAFT_695468 [Lasiosphaeria ovina]